jgi:hypothetical protein
MERFIAGYGPPEHNGKVGRFNALFKSTRKMWRTMVCRIFSP